MKRTMQTLAILLLLVLPLVLAACGDDDDDSADDDTTPAGDDDTTPAGDDDDDNDDDNDDDDDAWPGLYAGAARVDISPQQSVKMGGYGTYFFSESLCRWSQGTHDPIYATAVAYRDGAGEPIIQIVLDTVGVIITDVEPIAAALAAELDIAPERVIVSATHNHQSPDTVGIWGVMLPSITGRDDYFIDLMIDGAIEAGIMAFDDLRPAVVGVATGSEDAYHYNAQWVVDPDAPLDSTLTILKFTEPEGAPIATIANWACHPMIMGPQNDMISSDFVGPYYAAMDQAVGGVNMFVNGNLGAGIHPQNDEHEINYTGRSWGTWALTEFYGRGLAQSVQALLPTTQVLDDTTIDVRTRQVEGELRNPFFALVGWLDLIPRDIPSLGGAGITTMTAWHIGPVRMATAPGEVAPSIGLQLREIMGGEHNMIANIGQDWLGYIMTKQEYRSLLYFYFSMLSVGPEMGEAVLGAYEEIFAEE
jgi:Neutral/alkaline non-lysosomal ceramidase, N-terminal